MKNDTETTKSLQEAPRPRSARPAAKRRSRKTAEQALLRDILAALDLPRAAGYNDRDARLDLLEGRVAYLRGYIGEALDDDSISVSGPGFARAIAESFPVNYPVADEGGAS